MAFPGLIFRTMELTDRGSFTPYTNCWRKPSPAVHEFRGYPSGLSHEPRVKDKDPLLNATGTLSTA